MARTVLVGIRDSEGYSPEQIDTQITLQAMLESVQQAIEEFGADAKVVLIGNQRYGANFGRFQSVDGQVFISDAAPDEDDEASGHEW